MRFCCCFLCFFVVSLELRVNAWNRLPRATNAKSGSAGVPKLECDRKDWLNRFKLNEINSMWFRNQSEIMKRQIRDESNAVHRKTMANESIGINRLALVFRTASVNCVALAESKAIRCDITRCALWMNLYLSIKRENSIERLSTEAHVPDATYFWAMQMIHLCLLCIYRIHISPVACHWPNTNMEKDKIIRFSISFAIFCRFSPANLFDRKLSMDSIKVLSEKNTWKPPRGESTDHLWLRGLASTASSSNKCAEFKFHSNGIQFSDWLLK